MSNPYNIVHEFEETIAEYAGSLFAVSVDSCTNAIFLVCKYLEVENVYIPKYTYPGVACSIIHAGGKVQFTEEEWEGIYQLKPYPIYDSALRFRKGMYVWNSFYCLSFHVKKLLPIGRGGMILLNDEDAYRWLKKARFDGRQEIPLSDDNLEMLGWNMYMTPEQASRGLTLFQNYKEKEDLKDQDYPDLSQFKIYENISDYCSV